MGGRRGVLLTGATGLLGRYLLRNLLLSGRPVAVLVRDARSASARQRVEQLVDFWGEALGVRLACPVVLPGNLTAPGLGLGPGERAWLARSCGPVLHAAARVAFRPTPDGEPFRTNVEGTRHLVGLCAELGLGELHHVSTAFVCGDRTGVIREEDLDTGQAFHNDYERSKCEGERLLRHTPGLCVSVYRPSVVVGDSRTGYTSTYHGFYRFLELGDRLAQPAGGGRRRLPLRLPFGGEEPRNLVPVDWVADAITRIVDQPARHGRTYHLVARHPVPARLIKEVAEDLLGIDGVSWAGPGGPADPTPLEDEFLAHLREYWPYRDGDPTFDCAATLAALPDLPAPLIGRAFMARLIDFAVADRWGRGRQRAAPGVDCARYVEEFFPAALRRSSLARVSLDVTVRLEVCGPAGGQWTCTWLNGELVSVRRGRTSPADVVYRLDPPTFAAVVAGELPPQEAFLSRRAEIEGDLEKGLKLAVLFGQLARECPYHPPREEAHACPGHP